MVKVIIQILIDERILQLFIRLFMPLHICCTLYYIVFTLLSLFIQICNILLTEKLK